MIEKQVCARAHSLLTTAAPHTCTHPPQSRKPHRKRTLATLSPLPAAPFRLPPRDPLCSTILIRFTQVYPEVPSTCLPSLVARASSAETWATMPVSCPSCTALDGHGRKGYRMTALFTLPASRRHALWNTPIVTQYLRRFTEVCSSSERLCYNCKSSLRNMS